MLTMPPFNPAPAESLDYLPASFAAQQHTIADGPYAVQTYIPTRKIVFARNPAWQADPIRSATPTRTRSTSPRPVNRQQSSRSCRPTPLTGAWNGMSPSRQPPCPAWSRR